MVRYVKCRMHIQTAYQCTVLVPSQKARTVAYFLTKIEAYRTFVPYRIAILGCGRLRLVALYFDRSGAKINVVQNPAQCICTL